MPDHQQQTTTTTSTGQSASSSGGSTDQAQQLVGNQAIVDIISAQNQYTGPRELNPNKNGIVFMGMNEYAHDEANKLNALNRGRGGAVGARPQAKQDHIKRNGREFDLTTEAGCASYVATLGLPDQLAVDTAAFLSRGGKDARDELAQFIRILSEAEMGERSMDRMVLSGHSIGSQIWGDHNGNINFTELDELFDLFPKAAAQIEHLMLSACYSGGEAKMDQYHEMFPGLASIWAYHDSSPGTWTGAMDQMERWEGATRDGKDPGGVDPGLARGTRKSKNVSTWNAKDGYQGDKPMSIGDITRELDGQESMFQSYFNGDEEVETPQSGPLRSYYGIVQRALSHRELESGRVAGLEKRRDVTIRLLYFKLVSGKFGSHYGNQLSEGAAAAGLTVPALGEIGRKEALAFIDAMEAAGGDSATAAAVDLMKRGLRDLDNDVIPTSWV
ncbi:MAG: hypothetical protein VX265_17580 [Myxococcota bacterium]|nr:hypothetical protein [Myxococcota bacterium]